MDAWTALGVFLLGAAVGALLTAIAYIGKIGSLEAKITALVSTRDREAEGKDVHLGAA